MIRVEKFEDVVKFSHCHVAVTVLVDAINCFHKVLEFVVLENCLDEFLRAHGSLNFDWLSVGLGSSNVAHDIGGLVEAFVVSYINFSVHLLKYDIVLLIIDPRHIDPLLLVFLLAARESFEQLFEFSSRELGVVPLADLFENVKD